MIKAAYVSLRSFLELRINTICRPTHILYRLSFLCMHHYYHVDRVETGKCKKDARNFRRRKLSIGSIYTVQSTDKRCLSLILCGMVDMTSLTPIYLRNYLLPRNALLGSLYAFFIYSGTKSHLWKCNLKVNNSGDDEVRNPFFLLATI